MYVSLSNVLTFYTVSFGEGVKDGERKGVLL